MKKDNDLLKKIITWADMVLSAKDDETLIALIDQKNLKFRANVQHFLVANSPVSPPEEHPWGEFAPNYFEAGHDGFRSLVLGIIINEHGGSIQNAGPFAGKLTEFSKNIEEYENWVTSPLNPIQLQTLHTILHETLFTLAKQNDLESDISFWEDDDIIVADRLMLAVIYILSWQKYSDCVNFIWNCAKPWFMRMSEVIGEYSDDENMTSLWNSMTCIHNRVLHFDGLLYNFDEGSEDYAQYYQDDDEDEDDDDIKNFFKDKRS